MHTVAMSGAFVCVVHLVMFFLYKTAEIFLQWHSNFAAWALTAVCGLNLLPLIVLLFVISGTMCFGPQHNFLAISQLLFPSVYLITINLKLVS